jgi:hypothetical protein
MKFSGWVMSAGLVFAATAANAQMSAPYDVGRSPYAAVSDVDGPYVGGPYSGGRYAAAPPEMPGPRYGGPLLLPPEEVYTVVREAGFSPLGIPRQRGFVYTIAVIDRGGNDGRLVIDARNGRILRFMPAYRMGDNFSEDAVMSNGPAGPLPPGSTARGARVASHTPPAVPMPKASPLHAGAAPKPAAPLAAAPSPAQAQQSAAIQTKPADVPAPVAGPAIVEAKPAAPAIQPTQQMPKAQGLD